MDELEISGKRYLSTRRAAKEHKYTSDYVGQLIRGGKVVGKKVGRSWYVEETSLNAYLSGESTPAAPAVKAIVKDPVIEKAEETPVAIASVAEPAQKIEKVEEEKVFEPVIIKSAVVEERHIPIRTPETAKEKPMGGLRYVVDDEPALPEIKKKVPPVPTASVAVLPKEEPESVQEYEEEVQAAPHVRKNIFAVSSLVVAGIITLACTAYVSANLNSQIVVEEGQVASVGYTFN